MNNTRFVTYSWDDVGIGPAETAEELGYREVVPPEPVAAAIDMVLDSAPRLLELRAGYTIVSPVKIASDQFFCAGRLFVAGPKVAPFYDKSESMALFVCTAGPRIEQWSNRLMEQGDMLTGYAADIIASRAVERITEKIHDEITLEAERAGLQTTNRYSPGQCGWPVSDQQSLFSLLPKDFCGVRLTESSLMLPIKSTSGMVGIGAQVRKGAHSCAICDMVTCTRRRMEVLM